MPARKNWKSTNSKNLEPKIPGWLVKLDEESRERTRKILPQEEISFEEEEAFERQLDRLQRTKKAR